MQRANERELAPTDINKTQSDGCNRPIAIGFGLHSAS
jgi:hypothetical protein